MRGKESQEGLFVNKLFLKCFETIFITKYQKNLLFFSLEIF